MGGVPVENVDSTLEQAAMTEQGFIPASLPRRKVASHLYAVQPRVTSGGVLCLAMLKYDSPMYHESGRSKYARAPAPWR